MKSGNGFNISQPVYDSYRSASPFCIPLLVPGQKRSWDEVVPRQPASLPGEAGARQIELCCLSQDSINTACSGTVSTSPAMPGNRWECHCAGANLLPGLLQKPRQSICQFLNFFPRLMREILGPLHGIRYVVPHIPLSASPAADLGEPLIFSVSIGLFSRLTMACKILEMYNHF